MFYEEKKFQNTVARPRGEDDGVWRRVDLACSLYFVAEGKRKALEKEVRKKLRLVPLRIDKMAEK